MWIRHAIEEGCTRAARLRRLIGTGWTGAEKAQTVRTVMFTDIVGFTRLAETLAPRAVHALLEQHVALLARAIHVHGGTVEKVMGDGIVAFWQGDAASGTSPAVHAALSIRRSIEADNGSRAATGRTPVRLRVGLHAGPVHVAPLGGRRTLCGDTVNVAQRLEDAARTLEPAPDVAILASDAVVARSGPGFDFRDLGPLVVRGRHEAVRAYALDGA